MGGEGSFLIPVTQIDIGVGIIGSVLYFFTCIVFPILERQYGKCIMKCAIIFIPLYEFSSE